MQELTTDGDNEVVSVCFSDEPNQVDSIRKSILRSLPFNLTQRRIYGSLQRFNQNYVHLQHLSHINIRLYSAIHAGSCWNIQVRHT